jgi:hypothetical protein
MKVGTIDGLYPLMRVESRLRGYFINTEGEVFSTRITNVPRKLLGNYVANDDRYYMLNNRSYLGRMLLKRARANEDFIAETTTVPVAESVSIGIAGRGFVLATVQNGKMIFEGDPKIYLTEQSYRDEMARIASTNPDKKVVALKIVEAVSLIWS